VSRLPAPLIRLLLPIKRMGRRAIRSALVRYARTAPPPGGDPGRKVYILLVSAWGMGGTIRAAVNLAGYLADHHDVEIISTYLRRGHPYFPIDPRVKVTALEDQRPGGIPRRAQPVYRVLRRFSSALYHPADYRAHNHNLWTDVRLVRMLRRKTGIVIASRPAQPWVQRKPLVRGQSRAA